MPHLSAGNIEDLKVSKETTKESSCIKHGGGLVTKSCPTLATPCTVACQAPLSVGFSRQEYLEWVANSFSRGSSQPRNQTQVFCTADRFFTD